MDKEIVSAGVEIYRNIFTPAICQELIEMTPALSEEYDTFAGVRTKRKLTSSRRSPVTFFLHQLSETESQKYCDIIYDRIPNTKTTAFRIMQYPVGSCIKDHYDTWHPIDGHSNTGLIIQLNDPNSYSGGQLTIQGRKINLDIGDGVLYDYSRIHGVTTIEGSERWILNLRVEKS